MLQMRSMINLQKLPPTFADTWEQIKNAGLQAFGGVFDKVNGLLNSEGVQTALNNLIGGIYMAGSATEQFIDFWHSCLAVCIAIYL